MDAQKEYDSRERLNPSHLFSDRISSHLLEVITVTNCKEVQFIGKMLKIFGCFKICWVKLLNFGDVILNKRFPDISQIVLVFVFISGSSIFFFSCSSFGNIGAIFFI